MTDFSVNDGYFKISKESSFSREIAKELGLTNDEIKKMGVSLWNQIFAIAKDENMGNINNVVEGQVFKFSENGWNIIKEKVSKALDKNFGLASPEREENDEPLESSLDDLVTIQTEALRRKKEALLSSKMPVAEVRETTEVDTMQVLSRLQRINSKYRNWNDVVSMQNEINALPTNTERIIAYNKEFNSEGKNYVIVDKENCSATVYSADGSIIKTFEVALGRMIGDGLLVRKKAKDDLNLTTAGIYTVNYKGTGEDGYAKLYDDNILTLSNDALLERGVGNGETGVALHQVPNGNNAREEAMRKDGVSIENNRISDGCVNFLSEDFDALMKYIDGVGTKVYILPEDDNNYMCVKNGELQFAQKKYTGDVPTTRTANDTIQPIIIHCDKSITQEGNNMLKALCDYKEQLCKDLGLDNDTYNELALLALGIAGQETNYGYWAAGIGKMTPYIFKEKMPKVFNFVKEKVVGDKSFNSRGLTQMKLESYTDPKVQEMLSKYNINPNNLAMGENSAIATVIVLNSILKNELPSLKSKMQECGITNTEGLLYCWNNKKNEIKNGTATPNKNLYIQSINGFMNDFMLYQQTV